MISRWKTAAAAAVAAALALAACAGPRVTCGPAAVSAKGIPFHLPAPYLLASADNRAAVEYLPDMSVSGTCKLDPGSGLLGSNSFTLAEGWRYEGSATQSAAPAALGALGSLAGAALPLFARAPGVGLPLAAHLYKLDLAADPPAASEVKEPP